MTCRKRIKSLRGRTRTRRRDRGVHRTHSRRGSFLFEGARSTWSRRWRRDRDGIVPAQALDRIRYRICKIAEDIIKLEEMLGYLLEALDVIEIPSNRRSRPDDRSSERLEISDALSTPKKNNGPQEERRRRVAT